jgi:hypothetical protein
MRNAHNIFVEKLEWEKPVGRVGNDERRLPTSLFKKSA